MAWPGTKYVSSGESPRGNLRSFCSDTTIPSGLPGPSRQCRSRCRGGTASGPGIFDMKCGLVQGFWGIKALREAAGVDRHVVLLCNSDEELGSPHSRPLIEESARDSRATLVLEPSLGGALKTSRKGESRFVVRVRGRAAHTGLDPEKGISAVDELARLVLELHSYNDSE